MTEPTDEADLAGARPADPGDREDRRTFLRSLPRSAVRTAEQLAGLSSIMRRSVFAAGGALIRGVDEHSEELMPAAAESAPAVFGTAVAQASIAPEAALPPPVLRDPVEDLTPAQHAVLGDGAHLVVAVNDTAGAPHMTSSPYAWDGTIFRLPGRLSSARAIAIARDPRVSLLIHDADPDAWVAVTGVATLGPIDQVESEMLEILAASLGAEAAARRWQGMGPFEDWIVFHVRPTRFVWRAS